MIIWLWVAFGVLVGTMVVLDLGLVTRRPRAVTPMEGLLSFSLWVLAALGFSLLVWYVYEKNWLNIERTLGELVGPHPPDVDGQKAWVHWITAYVTELALSLDNIAIAALLLRHFKIPDQLVGRTLFWNSLISLVLRMALIFTGAWLMRSFGWVKWAFCGVLVLAMLRTLLAPDEQTDFDKRRVVRALRRLLPTATDFQGARMVVKQGGRWAVTPVALVVLVSCVSELTFAIDSVPALFSVTRDPFIAFTASTFALLALRSLYLALAGVLGRFRFLRVSLVFVLLAVAVKMFLVSRDTAYFNNEPTLVMLGIVAGIVALGVAASALKYRLQPHALPTETEPRPTPLEDLSEAVDASRRNFRKGVILLVGSSIVLLGIVIVGPLPGPGGIPVVLLGLTILATEFIWARRLLNKVKEQSKAMAQKADQAAEKTSPWVVPPVILVYIGLIFALAHYFPKRSMLIVLIGIGPGIAIGYWAFATLRAAVRAKRAAAGGKTGTVARLEAPKPAQAKHPPAA